ncbi:DUF4438 domain-containing protein [Halanaerobiaceae bacterium Z-7014]|uniref:DUF4438 domain-containing protein n=1 Tax=Halonatronomonas betaini TaxID=2778430 RepID=A0A931AS55_9FIRM|nr:DUF4438 domain-containing protein [Halonatronomonas betaini]MBF8437477.1 DUF4438 domain-containing protein [Halonatronomonas betaini]
MLNTNKDRIVVQSVQGSISHPGAGRLPYRMDREGKGHNIPGTGGISYNVRVGDPAFGWAGDHIEPGVSMKISDKSRSTDNYGLGLLACIGNKARVVSGEAQGAEGYVTGLHGGINHVIIDFDQDDMEEMKVGDDILVKAAGQGLELKDYPEIKVFNIAPELLEKLGIEEDDGKLTVPVAAEIPGHIMGSGIGASTVAMGDYDITTGDKDIMEEYGIDQLKLGDLVYLSNCDNTYGREYITGAGSIGVVVHSDCIKMGHGPGVTTILTSKESKLVPAIDPEANISKYMESLKNE